MAGVRTTVIITDEQDRFLAEYGRLTDRKKGAVVRQAIEALRKSAFSVPKAPPHSERTDYNQVPTGDAS